VNAHAPASISIDDNSGRNGLPSAWAAPGLHIAPVTYGGFAS